ncbi:MAG TPA: lysine--tRNA ligase [Candidatus Paceibacterota bacterium]
MSLEDIRKARLEKLNKLRKTGVDPYPAQSSRTHSIEQALSNFDKLVKDKTELVLAGRIMAKREQGGLAFLDIDDGSSKVQLLFKKDDLGENVFNTLSETIDIGDFIETKGVLFVTKRGEKTLEANSYKILTKSLLPLPEKWHGLQDVEERYRRRYLDLVMNPEVKKVFLIRSKIIEAIRKFLIERGYIEVQTPILQPIYGGGSARPFVSKLNTLDIQVYMRISNELYLKRLVVGGFEKIFEFSTDFRNEGIDKSHNPEFTLFEAMTAYEDYNFGMNIIEDITEYVVKEITGGTKINYQDTNLDFKKPWSRISMREAIKKYAGLDIEESSDKDLKEFLKNNKIEIKGDYTRGNAVMAISEEFCEKNFVQPTILYDYPAETSPLAKQSFSNQKYVERFEQYAFGMEIGNNYSELNNPEILKKNWEEQERALKMGDEEAQRMDEDFINALEIGMPPTCGIAISIDRLTMMLTNQRSIRDVILFPFMKPRSDK